MCQQIKRVVDMYIFLEIEQYVDIYLIESYFGVIVWHFLNYENHMLIKQSPYKLNER